MLNYNLMYTKQLSGSKKLLNLTKENLKLEKEIRLKVVGVHNLRRISVNCPTITNINIKLKVWSKFENSIFLTADVN